MDVSPEVTQAIADLRQINPRLHTALQLLNQQLFNLTRILEPIEVRSTLEQAAAETPVDAPVVGYVFTTKTIRFAWTEITGAALYEVRKGTNWDTAIFQFRTVNLSADVDPILTGSHTYLFKSINTGGVYSEDSFPVIVNVPAIDAVTLSPQVVDNNVIIDWDEPASVFEISKYNVYRDGIFVGFVRASFFTRFEVVGGDYTYSVIAVDIAGNESANSDTLLSVTQPPDYILFDVFDSVLGGTKTNIILESLPLNRIVGPFNLTQTWEDHFSDNTWDHIQDQIDAGYPLYGQPSYTSGSPDGSYEEIIDYGVLFTAVIATITWNFNQFDASDSVNIVVQMASSDDGITYTSFAPGASQLITNMQYLKFKLELTAASDKAIIEIFQLRVSLAVKRENDGGEIDAVSTDVGGTTVSFNKAFKDIDAVVATVKGTTSLKALVDFIDVANPTGFKVLVFNDAGVRQSARAEWHARGIV